MKNKSSHSFFYLFLCSGYFLLAGANFTFCFQNPDILINMKATAFDKLQNKDFLELMEERRILIKNPGYRAGDYRDQDVAFRLVIGSPNDQLYEENKDDWIAIVPYGADSVYLQPVILSGNLLIGVQEKAFRISKVAPDGSFIQLQLLSEEIKKEPDMQLFDRLPDFHFKTTGRGERAVRDFLHQGKFIYIYVWQMGSSSSLASFAHLREVYEKYGNQLEIISLNDLDTNEKKAIAFTETQSMNWVNGFSSQQINRQLHQSGYPYGVLFDEQGHLVQMHLLPAKLMKFLDRHFNNK